MKVFLNMPSETLPAGAPTPYDTLVRRKAAPAGHLPLQLNRLAAENITYSAAIFWLTSGASSASFSPPTEYTVKGLLKTGKVQNLTREKYLATLAKLCVKAAKICQFNAPKDYNDEEEYNKNDSTPANKPPEDTQEEADASGTSEALGINLAQFHRYISPSFMSEATSNAPASSSSLSSSSVTVTPNKRRCSSVSATQGHVRQRLIPEPELQHVLINDFNDETLLLNDFME